MKWRDYLAGCWRKRPKGGFGSFPDKPPLLGPDGRPVLIDRDRLKAGDILLVYTDPRPLSISWLVRLLAGGWYSHSAFFDGEQLIEAYREGGIRTTPVHERIHASHYVDVFRYVSDEGDEMGASGWSPGPVVEATNRYLGSPFGTDDLVFGAIIAVTRPLDLPGKLESHLRRFLDRAMQAFQDFMKPEAPEHITCSELVYRAFAEAAQPPDYRLRIETTHGGFAALDAKPRVLRDDAKMAGPGLEPETVKLLREFAGSYVVHKEKHDRRRIPGRAVRVDGGKADDGDAVADYVSPHDLFRSPNLKELGRAPKEGFPTA